MRTFISSLIWPRHACPAKKRLAGHMKYRRPHRFQAFSTRERNGEHATRGIKSPF
jgi:hypothetical protein